MMYEEFIKYLGSDEVTYAQYTEIIEPVYTWHPMFESGGIEAKQRCADLYKVGGLGIFEDIRHVADEFAGRLDEKQKAFNALVEAEDNYNELVAEINNKVEKYGRYKGK